MRFRRKTGMLRSHSGTSQTAFERFRYSDVTENGRKRKRLYDLQEETEKKKRDRLTFFF